MAKMKPTQELPSQYVQTGAFDLNENSGLAMILNLTGVGVLFAVAWLLVQSLDFLRPAYLSEENILVITGMREFWRGVLLLVISMGLMIVLNEGLRWLLFWVITGQRPELGFHGFYTYATAPEWYIARKDYILIRLAPLFLITLIGLAGVPIVALNLVPAVLLLVSLNIAAAVSDVVMVWWVLRQPPDIFVTDFGDSVCVYHYENKSA